MACEKAALKETNEILWDIGSYVGTVLNFGWYKGKWCKYWMTIILKQVCVSN